MPKDMELVNGRDRIGVPRDPYLNVMLSLSPRIL